MPHCALCRTEVSDPVETATVRSNVREFRAEQFRVFRCPHCRSIHARDEVDLAHYYQGYPFHNLGGDQVDWMLRAMYRRQLGRLRAAGLAPEHAVLDYGCGGGAFVRYLREQGYQRAAGYDQYSPAFSDPGVLSARYDVIVSQDVLEHVAEPWELLHALSKLATPGGVVALGTPNAEAIDLAHPEARVHTLHQPYHRHIASKTWLCSIGEPLGWELVRYYPTMYANTLVPFVNARFLTHYFRMCDDTLDLATEPIQTGNLKLYTPVTLFFAFFGYFFAPETDVMAVYRTAA